MEKYDFCDEEKQEWLINDAGNEDRYKKWAYFKFYNKPNCNVSLNLI